MPGQDVQHDGRCRSPFHQRLRTGSFHRIQPIGGDHAQDLDHLAITVRHLPELALNTLYRGRQLPVLERRAVAQGAWFARKNRDVVQRVVDVLVASEGALVLANDLAVLPELDALGIGADLDRSSDGACID